MTTTREQHLEYCEICNHNKYTVDKGIICTLSGKIADFDKACESFSENTELKEYRDKYRNQEYVREKTADISLRLVNFLIDSVFAFIFVLFITLLIKNFPILNPEETAVPYNESKFSDAILYILLVYAYYFILEFSTGRTFAKFITNTKVVTIELKKPNVPAILIRTLCRFIPFEPFSFLSEDGLGWHDKISKTAVIKC